MAPNPRPDRREVCLTDCFVARLQVKFWLRLERWAERHLRRAYDHLVDVEEETLR